MLDVATLVADAGLTRVPRQGPAVIVANHPHGALDGLVLAAALDGVRSDVRLLANRLLERVPEMRDLCFFVDPFGGPEAAARSRAGLRAAHLWLRRGGALVAFPAGEVAHLTSRSQQDVITHSDSPWIETVGRLAIASGATVVPTFIEGRNSRAFYAAGRLHPSLRTVLLPRELMRQHGRTIRVFVGKPIAVRPTSDAGAPQELLARARSAVDVLAANAALASFGGCLPPEPGRLLAAEIAALPESARLVESDAFQVFCAKASEIPLTLDEIGRLRELTYRGVGEGTGLDRDLDRFDEHYAHLFVWDRKARRVVGAYRIGDVQAIVRERGVTGLYTRQLFTYDERFVMTMGPALELGRSWVRTGIRRTTTRCCYCGEASAVTSPNDRTPASCSGR